MYEQLIAVESIPPLPATAARLLEMASDPDVDIDRLGATIKLDPALTAKVLGIANSAYYAPRQPVVTVKQAIVHVLGLRMVSNLSLGIALNGVMSNLGCKRFNMTRYWVVALGTAELSGGLARAAASEDKPDPDVAHLVGLLHNLGELLLVHLRPRDMNEVLRQIEERPELDVIETELEILGIDRWAAGAFLARHWELPAIVGDTIEQLGMLDELRDASTLSHLVGAARRWVHGLTVGRSDALQVVGVDDAYCEYRSLSFVEHYDALKTLATKLHA